MMWPWVGHLTPVGFNSPSLTQQIFESSSARPCSNNWEYGTRGQGAAFQGPHCTGEDSNPVNQADLTMADHVKFWEGYKWGEVRKNDFRCAMYLPPIRTYK